MIDIMKLTEWEITWHINDKKLPTQFKSISKDRIYVLKLLETHFNARIKSLEVINTK